MKQRSLKPTQRGFVASQTIQVGRENRLNASQSSLRKVLGLFHACSPSLPNVTYSARMAWRPHTSSPTVSGIVVRIRRSVSGSDMTGFDIVASYSPLTRRSMNLRCRYAATLLLTHVTGPGCPSHYEDGSRETIISRSATSAFLRHIL
jgi:hypothetical protein